MPNTATNDRGWVAVIETILDAQPLSYRIEVTDHQIILHTNEADALAIQATIQRTLDTPNAFFARLPYTITTSSSGAAASASTTIYEIAPTVVPVLQNTVVQGVQIFQRLFGVAGIREVALDLDALFDQQAGAHSTEQVLYSKPASRKGTATAWHSTLQALLSRFHDVDIVTLRKIWTGTDQHLPASQDDLDSEQSLTFKGLVQQCFGVIEAADHKKVSLFFNYGLLHRFIFPPQAQIKATHAHASNAVQVQLDKQHLLNYIQQLTQGGTLLKIYKENEHNGKLIARPIFLGNKEMLSTQHKYTIITDKSGSMGADLKQLETHIIQFIEKLKTFDAAAKVRIVFFANLVGPVKEFTVAQSWEIRDFINSVSASGGTRLFSTVEDELELLLRAQANQDHLTSVVLFTDGKDTNSGNRESAIKRIVAKFQQFTALGVKLPQLFTMGFGPEYDYEALQLFATQTNTPFIHLQSTNDFEQIYAYLNRLQYKQAVLDFLVTAHDTISYSIPITRDGDAHAPGILIPFQENQPVRLQFDGKSLIVNVPDASLVPLANPQDHLNDLLLTSNSVVASSTVNAQQKQLKLQTLQKKLANWLQKQTLTDQEQIALRAVQGSINYFIAELAKVIANKDEALHSGLKSKASFDLGFKPKITSASSYVTALDGTASLNEHKPSANSHGRRLLSIPSEDGEEAAQSSQQADATPEVQTSAAARATVPALLQWPVRAAGALWRAATTAWQGVGSASAARSPVSVVSGQAVLADPVIAQAVPVQPVRPVVQPIAVQPTVTSPAGQANASVQSLGTKSAAIQCTPVIYGDAAEPIPALHCSAPGQDTVVFAKSVDVSRLITDGNAAPAPALVGDTFKRDTCRPVEFYGRSAVTCDGSKTAMVYKPKLKSRDLDTLGSNIMLGRVLLHWASGALRAIRKFGNPEITAKDQVTRVVVTKEVFARQCAKIEQALTMLAQDIKKLDPQVQQIWLFALEEHRAGLLELRTKGDATKAELKELLKDLKYFKDDINTEIRQLVGMDNHGATATVVAPVDAAAVTDFACATGAPMLSAALQHDTGAGLAPPIASARTVAAPQQLAARVRLRA